MSKHQIKLMTGFILTAIAGGLLGVLVQLGNMASWGCCDIPMLAAFGEVSYGFFFWIFVCSALAYHARCGIHASLLTLSLLLPTLCGYRAAAWVFGTYLNRSVLEIGVLLLIPAAAAAWILRANRHRRWMRVMVRLIGTAALMFDIQARGTFSLRTMMLAMPLLVLFWYMMHCVTAKEMRRVPQSPLFSEWDECPMF